MPLSAYDASVTLFLRGLRSVKTLLQKAQAHAAASHLDPRALLDARLAGDMNGLATQAHWAAEGGRLAIARLLGETAAPPAPESKSFAELEARVDAAIAALEAVPRDAVEAAMSRTVALDHRGKTVTFAGDEYLVKFAIPNFYFHVAALYAILRNQGVALTKGDFMGDLFG
jgi:hypothetical protein